MSDWTFRFYDRHADKAVVERALPHWSQAGTLCFITWRTDDSIPAPVLKRWRYEKWTWLNKRGIDSNEPQWRAQVDQLSLDLQQEFRSKFSARWHEFLDQGLGACVLQRPELAKIVSESLLHFDRERYFLTDFIVMPNHVHLMCAFPSEEAMLAQCRSWKHYTAVKINRSLKRSQRFWQEDGFDHLVRSADQFVALRRYIAENPIKCRLKAGQFVHFTKSDLAAEFASK